MDFNKQNEVNKFITYKKTRLNTDFYVKLEIYQSANYWLHFSTELLIENNISKDDYTFIFMEDIIKPYLGYVQMNMHYVSDVKFDGNYLYFSNGEKKVRLS